MIKDTTNILKPDLASGSGYLSPGTVHFPVMLAAGYSKDPITSLVFAAGSTL